MFNRKLKQENERLKQQLIKQSLEYSGMFLDYQNQIDRLHLLVTELGMKSTGKPIKLVFKDGYYIVEDREE